LLTNGGLQPRCFHYANKKPPMAPTQSETPSKGSPSEMLVVIFFFLRSKIPCTRRRPKNWPSPKTVQWAQTSALLTNKAETHQP